MYKIIGSDQKEYGPVTAEQILEWIKQGRANGSTQIQAEGSPGWRPLSEFTEFAAALAAKAEAAAATIPPLKAPGVSGEVVDVETMARQINALGGDFSVGDCVSRGWNVVMQNFWISVGVAFVGSLVMGVPLLMGPMYAGLFYFYLKLLRGEKVEFGDSFAGFSYVFVPSLLAGILFSILVALGIILCVIPGIFLATVWCFTWPILIDKRLDGWQALELSRKVCTPRFWGILGLLLVNVLVMIAGLLVCYVGMFVAMPVTIAALAVAYESIFNPKTRATA